MALFNDSLKQLLQGLVGAVELRRAMSMWTLALGKRGINSPYQR